MATMEYVLLRLACASYQHVSYSIITMMYLLPEWAAASLNGPTKPAPTSEMVPMIGPVGGASWLIVVVDPSVGIYRILLRSGVHHASPSATISHSARPYVLWALRHNLFLLQHRGLLGGFLLAHSIGLLSAIIHRLLVVECPVE